MDRQGYIRTLCEIGAAILRQYEHPDAWQAVYDDEGQLKQLQLRVNELDPRHRGLQRACTTALAIRTWAQHCNVPHGQLTVEEPHDGTNNPYQPVVSVRARIWPEMTVLLATLR